MTISEMAVDVYESDIKISNPTLEFKDQQPRDAQPEITETANPPVVFRWEIRKFSELSKEKVYSETFLAGGFQWKVLLMIKKNGKDRVSLYLKTLDTTSLPFVDFRLTVINQTSHPRSVVQDICGQVNEERCIGFECFMPLGELLDPTLNFIVEDILIVRAEIFRCKKTEDSVIDIGEICGSVVDTDIGIKKLGAEQLNTENSDSYVGIWNEGFTCYMNSVIQTLYHIPSFRKAVYKIPTTKDENPLKSTALALQRLFYRLQFEKCSISTGELVASFESRWQSYMMQDAYEFCKFLSSELQERMKGTVSEGTMERIFQVHLLDITECLHVDYKSAKPDSSYELILPVKGCSGVYDSLDTIVGPEILDTKYDAGAQHGLQDAKRIAKFTRLPPVLRVILKRFYCESSNQHTYKINDHYQFPLELDLDRGDRKYLSSDANKDVQNRYALHSVLAHIGDETTGHYFTFIRPTLSDEWYKFDDAHVTRECQWQAVDGLFGCPEKGSLEPNAYMLMYIRESDKDSIMSSVDKEDIPEHLAQPLVHKSPVLPQAQRLQSGHLKAVRFQSVGEPRNVFYMHMPGSLPYGSVIRRVAGHLGVDDHSRIQLTSLNTHNLKPCSEPIQPHSSPDLHHMLSQGGSNMNILYYELLDIPQETESYKSLIIDFHPATTDAVKTTHDIRRPKSSTIGDLLDDLRTKVPLSHPGADLRMFEVFRHKIYKVFSPEEKIADINDQFITLRAEEVSEDEKNIGPKDLMIHVYHYADESQIKVSGDPYFLVIHEEEKMADIKPRLQKKARVSDSVFAEWKFAFLGLSNPQNLGDSDILFNYFEQEKDNISGAWQPFLGIHHPNDMPMDVD